MLSLYNDLTRKKEKFYPIDKKRVRMYVCGVTVYDDCHIGHARSAVVFDVLRRLLEYLGYEVTFVKNFTDIDDKIIKKASQEGIKTEQIAERYIKSYDEDAESLSIKAPTYSPRATDMIGQIVQMCRTLEDKGFAYSVDGDLFFDIKKFKSYGKLSGKNIVELEAGSRVEINKKKHHPLDFVLWKKSKPGEPKWQSPWGEGRPGWHIECSAMSTSLLGPTFDIHGGGEDLIFPHHENEIAQSEAATGKSFCRFWVHNGFVVTGGEKMSKSLKNFWTIKDILKLIPAEQLRYFLITTKYRSPLKFNWDDVKKGRRALDRLYGTLERINEYHADIGENCHLSINVENIVEKISDDLNTPAALGLLFDLSREANSLMEEGKFSKTDKQCFDRIVKFCSDVLGILQMSPSVWFHNTINAPVNSDPKTDTVSKEKEIETMIKKRDDARKEKNFKEADRIRKLLSDKGIILEDTATGTKWKSIN
ncbi:MAG: cysteine--tRNA ligase [bacterium]|nr:MAG: cysteine--tRNA ligase [bacterium]